MFDLTVLAKGGRWLLVDDEGGELGDFDSPAEALQAAGAYEAACRGEVRYVLVQEGDEWEEVAVDPPLLH
jgi:hypothetical protein